jgi:phosphoribosylanthranilate isomerase
MPRDIVKVGVFVDEKPERLKETMQLCKLNLVQLHGAESRDYAKQLKTPFVKAFRAQDARVLDQITAFGAETFLLDSYHPEKAGGTGRKLDLDLAAKAARLGRMIMAGGLDPDNVAEAILKVRPYAVDVSSGVELSPGKKDHDKIKKFITEVKQCARG